MGSAVTGRRREYNCANQMAVWKAGVTIPQQIFDDSWCLGSLAAAKTNEYSAKNSWIAGGVVQLCPTLFDLANEHVGFANRYSERTVNDIVILVAPLSLARNDVAGMREAYSEYIEIGRGPVCPALAARDHRIFGHGEISVDSEICLYERDSTIHPSRPCGPDGHRVVHVQRSAGTGMRE